MVGGMTVDRWAVVVVLKDRDGKKIKADDERSRSILKAAGIAGAPDFPTEDEAEAKKTEYETALAVAVRGTGCTFAVTASSGWGPGPRGVRLSDKTNDGS